jgi:hypothetical protein
MVLVILMGFVYGVADGAIAVDAGTGAAAGGGRPT